MSKRKSKRQPKRSQPRFQLATCEPLEARVLLAGDSFSAWQNPANPYDVNQDSHVTPADLLIVRQVLNSQGAHELPVRASAEPGSAATPMMLDANGDGFVSAIDAYQVVQAINGQGEGEEFQLRLDINAIEPDDSTGNVIDEVNIGDSFRLSVYVQDMRGADAFGIFSAYADVTYDSALVSVADGSTVVHAAPFDDGRFSDLSVPGLIDEAGGFDQSGTGDGSEQLLFQLDMVADAAGVVDFQSDPADVIPLREFLSHESATPIDAANILFGSTQLTVVDDQAPVDLAGFAQALTDAGVEFWTTQQFNTDAVSQRALFEDAYVYLPINEALDSAGDINAAATAENVTAVNTWIFPDDTQATGVLSLEELATRSGVSLPAYSGPTIRDPFADGTVSLEFGSPLNLGIDTYALSDGPITYTVTVDNPDLVESTVITGNRGWQLDVNGYGTMLFEFFENRASRATDQFISLTQDDFYDGLTFHRILEDFVIQGGDPLGTGTGGSDLPDFRDQFDVDLQHNQVGVLSMAKSADDTNNSQFFVTDGTPRHLDFNHTIFGQLIEGFDVLAGISAAPVQAPANQGRPVDSIVINSASVVDDQENGVVLLRALASTGTTNVTITATDGDGNSDSTTFEVNLAADAEDAQPFLLDIPEDLVAQAGTTFDFQVDGVDAEGDPINYDVNFTSPDGVTATVSDTGLVSVTIPDTVNAGDEVQIRVRAYDNFPNFTQSPRDEQLVTITVDDSITVVDDAFSIDEDSGLHTFDVIANDTGSGLTITSVTTPADGATVEITTDNQINYTPAPNFPLNSVGAQDSVFTYTVTSAGGQTATGTVTVTVAPVNDPPTANDDAFPADFTSIDTDQIARLREDATENALLRLILNDAVTPDEEIPGISATESLTGASLQVVNINTAVNYRAAANVFGTDTFTYTLTDPGGLSDTATVTVEIAQVNDAPETVDDAIEVVAGVASSISAATLLDNDTAGPLEDTVQTLSITSVTQPANGTVTLNSDGSLSYTANPGFSGTDTFTYTITDDGITENFDTGQNAFVAAADPLTATGTVTVTATVNEFAADDAFDVDGRRDTVSLDVLNNDDVTLSPTITSITQPTNGTAAIINNGLDISYSRNDNFVGNDSFTYTLTDSGGNTSTATVSLNVLDPVTPPIAQDDSFTVQNDGSEQSFSVLANDEVDAGETASIVSIQLAPTNGTASVSTSGDAILYTPNAGFAGTETIVYQMTDGNGGFDSASVTVTVESTIVNPVANDDVVTFDGIPPQAFDVLANDTTEAGETLTIDSIVTPPTNGVASISTDGTQILYEPIDDQVTADTLVYRISDGNGGTDTATVSITIRQNEDPVAVADTFTINATGEQSFDVLANDTTEAGETLTISAITVAPNLGSATIAADGLSILYTPTPGTTDTDTLTYEISDGNGGTATAVVTLNVDVANQNPVAVDDTADLDHIGEQSIDVLANDTTEAGETLTITATGGTPAGSVTIGTDGTSILYTPAANAGGTTDSFTYTISDGNGGTAEGTVTVSIADNLNPVAVDETVTLDRTGEQTIDVLANDTTEAGETLTITATGGTPAGSVAISTDGTSILYTPATDAGGTSDSFTYTISDGNGGTAEGTVTVNIQANEAPVANDDTASLMPTGEQTIDVLANDTTEAGETLTITAIGGTAAGTVSISTDGTSILYTPAANATGTTDTFTYTISDGNGGTSEATVTVNLADLSTSFVAGTIYQDVNGNGTQDANEPGIGGVPLVLEGTDVNNATVRMEVRSALDGSYRIEGIAPGDYSISQVQPQLLSSVSNSFGTEDTFDIQVSEDLIASDGNLFGESGLPLRFAMLDAITSNRTPGVLVVLQGDELSWMESRSGWEGVDSLMVTRSGDDLTIETSSGSTVVSMFDRSVVELIGGTSEFTILRLNGTSDQVMSAAAVDAVMAG